MGVVFLREVLCRGVHIATGAEEIHVIFFLQLGHVDYSKMMSALAIPAPNLDANLGQLFSSATDVQVLYDHCRYSSSRPH